jgi:dephospho-CoA kinase
MRVIGLTGGIASGKSTVSDLLRRRGLVILDADEAARRAVEPGTPALEAIRAEFGPGVLTPEGSLDRKALAARVFGNEPARLALNAIVHPAVRAEFERELRDLSERVPPPRAVVLDVPLLYESGMERMAEAVWVVALDPRLQRERLMARDHMATAEAEARIASQWPLSEKVARADRVIWNEGSPEDLARAVDQALLEEGLA